MAKDILRNRHASVKFAKEKKQRGVAYMSKLINDLVGKQCIIRSEFIFGFAGKTELSCKIIDADDEWIKICYTEKKDKQVVKLMRIENIESICFFHLR